MIKIIRLVIYAQKTVFFALWIIGSTFITMNSYAASGASFLKIPVGARAAAMGNAYTAVANDVSSLYWNPAGLSRINKREVSAMHSELFADTNYDFIGYAHPLKTVSLGFGAVYLSQGAIEGRGEDRRLQSGFTASDLALTFGAAKSNLSLDLFAREIPIAVGANLKVIQSKIEGFSSSGFAFDLGVNADSPFEVLNAPVNLGFSVRNIGPEMKFIQDSFKLPLTLTAGAELDLSKSRLPLTLSMDVQRQPNDSLTSVSFGAEITPFSVLAVRAGYLTNAVKAVGSDNSNLNDRVSGITGMGLGIGLKLGFGAIDYSVTPAGELGNSQSLSLTLKF